MKTRSSMGNDPVVKGVAFASKTKAKGKGKSTTSLKQKMAKRALKKSKAFNMDAATRDAARKILSKSLSKKGKKEMKRVTRSSSKIMLSEQEPTKTSRKSVSALSPPPKASRKSLTASSPPPKASRKSATVSTPLKCQMEEVPPSPRPVTRSSVGNSVPPTPPNSQAAAKKGPKIKLPRPLTLKQILPRPRPPPQEVDSEDEDLPEPSPRPSALTGRPSLPIKRSAPSKPSAVLKPKKPVPECLAIGRTRTRAVKKKRTFECEFEVESIKGKRVRNDKIEYLIKWAGWESTTNTWEPEEHLKNCQEMVDLYNRRTTKVYKGEFEVERIVRKFTDGPLDSYLVKWKGWTNHYNTWEPPEHLTHCRNIVDEFNQLLARRGLAPRQV